MNKQTKEEILEHLEINVMDFINSLSEIDKAEIVKRVLLRARAEKVIDSLSYHLVLDWLDKKEGG